MKNKLTKEEKQQAQEMYFAFKILMRKANTLYDLPDKTFLRNSIGEVRTHQIGEMQIQMSLVKDKSEWIEEDGISLTKYV